MINFKTEFSKLRLESASINFDGSIHMVFLEYIPSFDESGVGVDQYDFKVEYRDVSFFDSNPTFTPYKQAATMLWDMRDVFYNAYING